MRGLDEYGADAEEIRGANAEGAEITQRTQKNTKNRFGFGFGFGLKALRFTAFLPAFRCRVCQLKASRS